MAFGNTPGTPSTYVNQDTGDAILKEFYSDDGVTNEIFMENPFLALVPKKEDVTGRFYNQPVAAGAGQGRSSSFTQAQNAAATSGEALYDFQIAKVENHADATISSQLIAESSSSKGAFLDMVRLIADNQLQNIANDCAQRLYKQADNARGIVAGSVAGTTLSFSNVADAVNFELGMWLDFSSSSTGTSTTFASTTSQYCSITAIDYILGTATIAFSSGTNTLTANSVAVGNNIYQSGDKSLGWNGFQDWIPQTVASNDSFFVLTVLLTDKDLLADISMVLVVT